MKITKKRLTRIIKEEISNVLEIKYKSGDWSYQSPEREKELEAARVKIQNKMDILATKMDDLEASLTATITDEQERAYAELQKQYNEQSRLLRAVTPAAPPEPEPEPEKEEDSLDYRMRRDYDDAGPRDKAIMRKIKRLIPTNIRDNAEAADKHIDDAPDDSELENLVHKLFSRGNFGQEDLVDPKMWNSIP